MDRRMDRCRMFGYVLSFADWQVSNAKKLEVSWKGLGTFDCRLVMIKWIFFHINLTLNAYGFVSSKHWYIVTPFVLWGSHDSQAFSCYITVLGWHSHTGWHCHFLLDSKVKKATFVFMDAIVWAVSTRKFANLVLRIIGSYFYLEMSLF